MIWRTAWLVVVCSIVMSPPVDGADFDLSKIPIPEEVQLSDPARELLGANGFVVAGNQYLQIFEPYIRSKVPIFVTTDCMWHSYHVLLEESVRQAEEALSDQLRSLSGDLLKMAVKRSLDPDYQKIASYLAVGLALQDVDQMRKIAGEELAAETERMLQLLEGGSDTKVRYLGLPFSAARLNACSFYAESETLRRYFAARQWYALCDFRAANPGETKLALKLSLLVREAPAAYAKLTEGYEQLLGPADDGDVARYLELASQALGRDLTEPISDEDVATVQAVLLEKLPEPKINDQLLPTDVYADFGKLTRGFRFLPPRRTPSAELFQSTVTPRVAGRTCPSGLDFFATGPLASDAGKRALKAHDAEHAGAIESAPAPELPKSLHGRALRLLARLQEPPPEEAPAACRTSAWHDKQLNTQLAAWAEQRHTFALHSKLTTHTLGISRSNPGVVSPYPSFFEGLGALARDTSKWVAAAGERRLDIESAAKMALRVADTVDYFFHRGEGPRLPDEHLIDFENSLKFVNEYFGDEVEDDEVREKKLRALRSMVKELLLGRRATAKEREVLQLLRAGPEPVGPLLKDFATLCDRLAGIARQQLAGTELSEGETDLLLGFGFTLARFHFYEAHGALFPRDDHPICAPVFASPFQGATLHAAVARPETIYVAVEAAGKWGLYRGAVLSYREFNAPGAVAMTDEEWRAKIDFGQLPEPLPFTKSYRVPGQFPLKGR